MHFNVLNRRVHYWAAAAISIPLLVIIAAGIVLQLKKHSAWVQPPEQIGSVTTPALELSDILNVVKARPELNVTSWDDVNRLDVRPDKGVVKVWLKSDWEAQVDLGTGEILQIAFRRSDWIESIHDGSIFGDSVKLGIFFPTAIVLLGLWLTGMWMWLHNILNKRRVRRRKAAQATAAAARVS